MTKATIYSGFPDTDRWHVGLGFNTHLAVLGRCEDLASAADEALDGHGVRRVGDWLPHPHRDGWLVAKVDAPERAEVDR